MHISERDPERELWEGPAEANRLRGQVYEGGGGNGFDVLAASAAHLSMLALQGAVRRERIVRMALSQMDEADVATIRKALEVRDFGPSMRVAFWRRSHLSLAGIAIETPEAVAAWRAFEHKRRQTQNDARAKAKPPLPPIAFPPLGAPPLAQLREDLEKVAKSREDMAPVRKAATAIWEPVIARFAQLWKAAVHDCP